MAKSYGSNIDLKKHELQNAVVHKSASDPSSPAEGQIYYNTVSKKKRTYNGTTWDEDSTGGSGLTAQQVRNITTLRL